MVEKFIMSISMLTSFTVFKNTVFRSTAKSRYFNKNKKILLSEAISIVAFITVSFFMDSSSGISDSIQSGVEGLFMGWMASLAGTLGRKNS